MNTKYLLRVLLLGAAPMIASAQAGSGGPFPTNPVTPINPTEVPLDGGASLLLASGVAYGLRQLRQRRRAR
jgi:hypothetical protein